MSAGVLVAAQDARDNLRIVAAELEGAVCRLGLERFDGWEGNAAQGARSRLVELCSMLESARSQAEFALNEAEARVQFVEDSLAAAAFAGAGSSGGAFFGSGFASLADSDAELFGASVMGR